jgi:4-hydroxybenzoate polyprenyltransferase
VGILWLWIAGFDIIYASQDEAFDRQQGLNSLVVRLGRRGAMITSALCHGLCWLLLVAFGWSQGLGPIYYLAVFIVGLTLIYLHGFRRGASLDDLNQDFFQANVAISLLVMAGIAWEVFGRG